MVYCWYPSFKCQISSMLGLLVLFISLTSEAYSIVGTQWVLDKYLLNGWRTVGFIDLLGLLSNAWWIQLMVINIIIRVIVSYLDCSVILTRDSHYLSLWEEVADSPSLSPLAWHQPQIFQCLLWEWSWRALKGLPFITQSFYHRLCKWQPLTGKCGGSWFGINAVHLERGMLRQQIFREQSQTVRSRTERQTQMPWLSLTLHLDHWFG